MHILKHSLILLFSLLYLSVSGCFFFEETKVSLAEIKKSSSWNSSDQPPSYEQCEGMDVDAQKVCFESQLNTIFTSYFENNPLLSNQPLEEEIVLTLKIDKEGVFYLEESNLSSFLLENVEGLENEIFNAVTMIPPALPAIKTNVGERVATKFQLPIMIQASPVGE